MRSYIRRLLTLVFTNMMVFVVQIATTHAAIADVTLKDVQTIVRTVGFLETISNATSVMAIIYDPDNSNSLQDARTMENLIKNEKKNIEPRLISISNMAGLQNADFAFLTSDLQPHYNSIESIMNKNSVLSFTLDRACVDQGYCAVYINSAGRVEIVVNKTVTDKIDARFKPVFLMMVTVI